jgi:hypothetical protein
MQAHGLRSWILSGTLLLASGSAYSQFPEDALRLSLPGIGVGARALGMGTAYTGIASDYSAIYWNPAGLAQLKYGEFMGTITFPAVVDEGTFFGNTTATTTTGTHLGALGFAAPFPVKRGSFVVALGFHRDNSFANGLGYEGFNPSHSFAQNSAPDGQAYGSDLSENLSYQLYLADLDTVNGVFISPIRDRVTQIAQVTEAGGVNAWSLAGAVDLAHNFALGVTLTYHAGSYSYDRRYSEEDRAGLYQAFPFDFAALDVDEYIDDDISGFSARFGVHYRGDFLRFGLAATTPTWYSVKETFGVTNARSTFDDGSSEPAGSRFTTVYYTEYDVTTPWVLSGGIAFSFGEFLVLSGSADVRDYATMKFGDATPEVEALNTEIQTTFRPTINLRAGAEMQIPLTTIRLRGGAMYLPSPYRDDDESFARKYLTGGVGILFGGTVMLEAAYAYGWWNTFRANDVASTVSEKITSHTAMLGLSYRF